MTILDAGLEQHVRGVSLAGVVSCLPTNIVDNTNCTSPFEPSDVSQLLKTTGVYSRFISSADETTEQLCLTSASHLLSQLNWSPKSIKGVILFTQTPSYKLPSTACVIQNKLGLPTSSFAFDVNLGCSAYPYGLWLAASLMSSALDRVLLLCGDTISHIVDTSDRATSLLFGDAGSATALQFNGDHSWSFLLGSDGSGASALHAAHDSALSMHGTSVFEFTLRRIPPLLHHLHSITRHQPDYYLFHQANQLILKTLQRKCNIHQSSFLNNIADYGNTSSASIPLLMTTKLPPLITDSTNIALVGYGVGLSWSAASICLSTGVHLETLYL